MANHSIVAHGSIPREEFIVKDGRTYYPFAGPLGHIKEDIQYHKHKKWGFMIYRCDYASDKMWNKFLSNLNWEVEEGLRISKGEELQDTMEMTVKEDKDAFDGATIEQIRDNFKEWVKSDEARAEINDGPCGAFVYPRYTYCVHVDAGVLASIDRAPQPPEFDPRETAYVNLIQLRLEDFAEDDEIEGDFGDCEVEEVEEEEEEEDEVFTKVPLSYIGPDQYDKLYDRQTFERYVSYQRSDGVSFGAGGVNPEDYYGALGS